MAWYLADEPDGSDIPPGLLQPKCVTFPLSTVRRCEKTALGRDLDAFHFAMAATEEGFAGEGHATVLLDQAKAFCVATLRPPGLGFAYIEASTVISLGLSDNLGHAQRKVACL